jgi:hypothetical protein
MKRKLKDIAHIETGYHFRGKVEPDPEGRLRVVQIKDIDADRQLHADDLINVRFEGSPEKYLLGQGDVLFLARGREPFAALVSEPLKNTIATGYFFILRPKADNVEPGYLAWYINQQPFQAPLRSLLQGTHMPVVTRADIQDLSIELPPVATQKMIVALDALQRRERQLLRALEEKRSQLVQAISLKAAQASS